MNRLVVPIEGSANVKQISYDHDTSTVQIDFHRGSYRYLNVPKAIFLGLWEAESKGKYIKAFIEGHYEAEKVEE